MNDLDENVRRMQLSDAVESTHTTHNAYPQQQSSTDEIMQHIVHTLHACQWLDNTGTSAQI